MTTRGTSNRNQRGDTVDRQRRKQYLLSAWQSIRGQGTCLCYRCGRVLTEETITVDRITPGAKGGRYTRENIRPACARCNSETGGRVRS